MKGYHDQQCQIPFLNQEKPQHKRYHDQYYLKAQLSVASRRSVTVVCCLSSRGELFKAGFIAKFEFRYHCLKSNFSLFLFCLQFDYWMLQQ